ncbi:sugar-binding transcriptional regulator [Terrabacter terrae]|uniref:Sugar-binding transcriptional regulator n=2 Tax=Terrabacter terrae TaxID=318434 RepID=A0ABN2TSE4_9MICO
MVNPMEAGDAAAGVFTTSEDTRLMTKVARLYHEQGVRQPEIAKRLNISQPRVSRLLKKAVATGIVRTTVVAPRGVFAEIEDEVEQRYGLQEVVVADTGEEDDEFVIAPALGAAAAFYLETTLTGGERIGVSSWSSTLLATVDSMRPRNSHECESVVQVLGGLGQPSAQARATHLVGRLVQVTGAKATYLPAPGLVTSDATRRALLKEDSIAQAIDAFPELTVLLAGIGSLLPSALLRASGNAVSTEDEERLREAGAVGDVCMRYFDAEGKPVKSHLDNRILGIDNAALLAIPRRIGVAGGRRKHEAIRAALLGGWINTLVTDSATAAYLRDAAR